MPKYKLSAEERAAKVARKEKLRELMSEMHVKDMNDINSLFKEMVGDILENGLEAELDEELGSASTITETRIRITAETVTAQRQ